MKKRGNGNGSGNSNGRGRAHLKTGYLEGIRALAGYLLDRRGERWLLVAMVNHPNAVSAKEGMDPGRVGGSSRGRGGLRLRALEILAMSALLFPPDRNCSATPQMLNGACAHAWVGWHISSAIWLSILT